MQRRDNQLDYMDSLTRTKGLVEQQPGGLLEYLSGRQLGAAKDHVYIGAF
jgi:hypothetical protein